MLKKTLRQTVLAQLKSQDRQLKAERDQDLLAKILASSAYQEAKVLATYLAFDHEFDTSLLIAQAQKDGKTVLVPKTYGQGRMIFVVYDEADLALTKFGLLEPQSEQAVDKSQIDLIHVPGVVFNQKGFRIGYGGGYYDRYLADYEGATLATIYDFQAADFEPASHDIAVKELYCHDN